MRRMTPLAVVILCLAVTGTAAAAPALVLRSPSPSPKAVAPTQDFPFLARLPGMKLEGTEIMPGAIDFWKGDGQGGYQHFEPHGGSAKKTYSAPASLTKKAFVAAYAQALARAGWKISYKEEDTVYAHYARGKRDLYAILERGDEVIFTVSEVLPPIPITLPRPAATPARVGAKSDFPFLKSLPGMKLDVTETSHDEMDFWFNDKNGEQQHFAPAGGYVTKRYDGPKWLSNYRLVESYGSALTRAGWKITYRDPGSGNLYAHYTGNGRNIYVSISMSFTDIGFVVAEPPAERSLTLKPPARAPVRITDKDDFPYLTRLPGWKLDNTRHGTDPLLVHSPTGRYQYVGSGTVVKSYVGEKDIANDTFVNTYAKALKKAGWKIVKKNAEEGVLYVHYTGHGRDVWAELDRYEHPSFHVADAGTGLKAALDKGCKVAVYGLHFDFNKATLRPDSRPVLEQVLALFKGDRKLKLEIGGHTDNVGRKAYNQTLSERRAAAVKAWLVAHGVARSRLSSRGYGENKPLVPNDSDAHRARNRRVELRRPGCKT